MNDEASLFDNELRYLNGAILDPSNRTKYEAWHAMLQGKFVVHPTVKLMIERHRPKDVRQLALEYPHVSEKDATRLAYTRTAADGANDRQLVTSIGKYLSRHWPETKDDVRRDAQATYSPDRLEIFSTTPDIIRGIEDGPRSCMASVYGSIPFTAEDANQMRNWFASPDEYDTPDWSKHPYSGYRPEYGWSIALRITPAGKIDGRALIYKDDDALVFLRTYRRHPTDKDGWSETDFTLQEWLKYQGYKMVDRWPEGAKIHTPSKEYGRIFAPYIDGERKGVNFDDQETSTITHGMDYTHWCEDTSGVVEPGRNSDNDEDYELCDDCGSRQHLDDMYWTGRGEDNHVCEGCITGYTWVRGESSVSPFREYYVPDDDAAFVVNNRYLIDKDNLPDDVVELEGGDFAERDDCVSIDGEYYLVDDYRVVYLEDNDDLDDSHGLKSDCHEVGGKWWYDEAHYLEFNPRDSEGDEVESLTAIES